MSREQRNNALHQPYRPTVVDRHMRTLYGTLMYAKSEPLIGLE